MPPLGDCTAGGNGATFVVVFEGIGLPNFPTKNNILTHEKQFFTNRNFYNIYLF